MSFWLNYLCILEQVYTVCSHLDTWIKSCWYNHSFAKRFAQGAVDSLCIFNHASAQATTWSLTGRQMAFARVPVDFRFVADAHEQFTHPIKYGFAQYIFHVFSLLFSQVLYLISHASRSACSDFRCLFLSASHHPQMAAMKSHQTCVCRQHTVQSLFAPLPSAIFL